MTSRLVAAKDKNITKEVLWDIYFHGALRKSVDWAFQNEWRLLLPLRSKNAIDYNVKFFLSWKPNGCRGARKNNRYLQ